MAAPTLTIEEIFDDATNPSLSGDEELKACSDSEEPHGDTSAGATFQAMQNHLHVIDQLSSLLSQPVTKHSANETHAMPAVPDTRGSSHVHPHPVENSPAEVLEYARQHSCLLFPFALPDKVQLYHHPQALVCPDHSPIQKVSPSLPAPTMEQLHYFPVFVPNVQVPKVAEEVQVPQVAEEKEMEDMEEMEQVSQVPFSGLPQLQQALAPPIQVPAEMTTNMTTMKSPLSPEQVEIANPLLGSFDDFDGWPLSMMTDFLDLQNDTLLSQEYSGVPYGAHEPASSEPQLNLFNPSSPIDWNTLIDLMPDNPSADFEFLSLYDLPGSPSSIPMPAQLQNPTLVADPVPKPQVPYQSRNAYLAKHHVKRPKGPPRARKPWKSRQKTQMAGSSLSRSIAQHGCASRAPKSASKLSVKRPRLKWTAELHKRFETAVDSLGGPDSYYATPNYVYDAMGCKDDVTYQHIKSHLQKYRCNPAYYQYDSGATHRNVSGIRRRGSKLTPPSAEETAAAAEVQELLAGTLTQHQEMQEQLPQLMEKSMALHAQLSMIEERGEQLKLIFEQRKKQTIDPLDNPMDCTLHSEPELPT